MRRGRGFLRTPKGLTLAVLCVLLVVAGRVEGIWRVGPGLFAAVATAMTIDLPILRWRRGRWVVPDGGLLTACFVGAIVSPREPWFVSAAATAVAIVGKHVVRGRYANVFNPAAFGLVTVYYLFDSAESWWGALLAIVPGAAWPLLLCGGIWVAARVNRLPLVVAFLATYFTAFGLATFLVDERDVAAVFIAPDLLATMFFAVFMLTDPPTSPARARAQVVNGGIVAAASVTIYLGTGAAHYLLSGLLCGNVVEGARRAIGVRRRLRES
jgi:Na+-translocating ferredoxin:NAD+ oxidoreductase RnfD subunit